MEKMSWDLSTTLSSRLLVICLLFGSRARIRNHAILTSAPSCSSLLRFGAGIGPLDRGIGLLGAQQWVMLGSRGRLRALIKIIRNVTLLSLAIVRMAGALGDI